MSNNAIPPVFPVVVDGRESKADAPPTVEVDGERVLDPDANDDLINSAEADRLATDTDEADET